METLEWEEDSVMLRLEGVASHPIPCGLPLSNSLVWDVCVLIH